MNCEVPRRKEKQTANRTCDINDSQHMFDIQYTQFIPQKIKSFFTQWFCKQISKLIFSTNKLNFTIFISDMVSNEMMANFNMFSPGMLNWILCKINDTGFVT